MDRMIDPPQDEGTLIRRCRKGNEDAIRALVGRYEGAVFRLVWRMLGDEEDARDVVQDAFVRALRSLDQFDPSRSFRNWLFRIASNRAIDILRRRRMRTVSIDLDADSDSSPLPPILVDSGERPDEAAERMETAERLAECVDRLPPEYRAIIQLRHYDQLSYEEIAEVLDLPMGTVKARLHRAHHRLRILWEGPRPRGAGTAPRKGEGRP